MKTSPGTVVEDPISISRKELAERLLHLDGKPFSLYEYPQYHAYYRGTWESTLLMCGRQVGKSVSAAAFTLADSLSIPHFKTLYISPSQKQTSAFSVSRVGKILRHSPHIDKILGNKSFTDNVFLKILPNGSEMHFTYACDDPDRARGLSADKVNYDEVQDILYDEVVPVINECMANSEYGYVGYMGTPKTTDNTIEYLWSHSTQTEWCIKCDGCKKSSFYRTPAGIGKRGIICLNTKCGKYLNPRYGRWVDMSPDVLPKSKEEVVRHKIKGFHVPQLILPKNNEDPNRWARILNKLDNYSETRFKNEVLGVSDSIGTRLISLEDLQACCQDYKFDILNPKHAGKDYYPAIIGGVDWSGGGSKGHSRTVAWVWAGYGSGNYRTLWYRIFPAENPVATVAEIARVMNIFGVHFVVGDSGEGHLANAELKKKLGDSRVYQVQLGDFSTSGQVIKWNGTDRYLVDRTAIIDNFLMQIKRKKVIYPKEEIIKPAFDDLLNVYEEVLPSGRKVWRHAPANPDDALMAQIFGWIGVKIKMQDLTFYS